MICQPCGNEHGTPLDQGQPLHSGLMGFCEFCGDYDAVYDLYEFGIFEEKTND